MSASTVWWIATGALVATELATGTFYLLMLAIGTLAAALAAHAGIALTGQLLAAALVGGGATAAWNVRRSRSAPAGADRNLNLDVGERVDVGRWRADGTARIGYRGSDWSARFAGRGTAAAGAHVIIGLDGNVLLLDRAPG